KWTFAYEMSIIFLQFALGLLAFAIKGVGALCYGAFAVKGAGALCHGTHLLSFYHGTNP
ncbi:hypothetical protein U1Q18_002955, partial [Sarracenia purpurea var. burkii]